MSEQKEKKRSSIWLIVLLCIALFCSAVFGAATAFFYQQFKQIDLDLTDLSVLQEQTAETLTSTESALAQKEKLLTDMTALQETTAAMLAAADEDLQQTQASLTDMTAKQEATAAALAATETELRQTQTYLAEMTAQQEATAAALATTETELQQTQTSLAEMTAQQEATTAALETAEAELQENQKSLADMTVHRDSVLLALTASEEKLKSTQRSLSEVTSQYESAQTALQTAEQTIAEKEAELIAVKEENAQLTAQLPPQETVTAFAVETHHNVAGHNDTASSGYKVLNEYEWQEYGVNYLAIVVENTSGASREIRGQVVFYDRAGGLAGVSDIGQMVCGNGEKAYLYGCCETEYASYAYSIDLNEPYAKSLNGSIAVSATINAGKVILSVQNTGNSKPEFVEINCLFKNRSGEVIQSGWDFIEGPAPGKTVYSELYSHEAFDSVEVYYTAYAYDF